MSMHNGAKAHDGAALQHDAAAPQKVEPQPPLSPPPAPRDVRLAPSPGQPDDDDGVPAAPVPPRAIDPLPADISVIGSDLAISGQNVHVISKGKIRVEGRIQGDVLGTEVVIGDVGTVEGVVSGDTVRVFGSILGTIRGVQVEIEAGAKVEADVHHHTLSVDARAQIEGRVRRARDIVELKGAEQTLEDASAVPSPEAPQQAAPANPRKGRLWG